MSATEEELDSYIEVLLMDRAEVMRQDEEAEEEAERRRRGKTKKMKTAATKSSKKADVPVEESGSELGKVESISPAKSDLARARKILKAAEANMWKSASDHSSRMIKKKTTPMTEEDLAAAAVYRAKAEEAHRNHEESDALAKWLATGDPEAAKRRGEWIEEKLNAMDLATIDPTEDLSSDRDAVEAKRFREFWEYVWADCFGSFEDTSKQLRIPSPF